MSPQSQCLQPMYNPCKPTDSPENDLAKNLLALVNILVILMLSYSLSCVLGLGVRVLCILIKSIKTLSLL